MLARHGFSLRHQNGSHLTYIHSVHPDKIVGIVHGAKTLVYQRQAAQACLDIQALSQQPPSLPQTTTRPSLPAGMEYVSQYNKVFVRSIQNPILGFEYNDDIDFENECELLNEADSNLAEGLNRMRDELEFIIAHNTDGHLILIHPVYGLEETIYPYGTDPQAHYPIVLLQHLIDQTNIMDSFLRLQQQDIYDLSDMMRINKKRLSRQLVQFEFIPNQKFKDVTPTKLIMTNQGRMSPETKLKDMRMRQEIDSSIFKQWNRVGFEFIELPDNKCRLTHKFMDIDIVMDSIPALHAQMSETIEILLHAATSADDHEDMGEEIKAILNKKEKANTAIARLNGIIDDFYFAHIEEFDALSQKLNRLGYVRHIQAARENEFASISFVHPKPEYDDLTLPIIDRRALTGHALSNVTIKPYPTMIQKMRDLYAKADRQSRPIAPKKQPAHALLNTQTTMRFNIGQPQSTFTPKKPLKVMPKNPWHPKIFYNQVSSSQPNV